MSSLKLSTIEHIKRKNIIKNYLIHVFYLLKKVLPNVHRRQFTTAKCWKQPKCPPLIEWIKKLWYIYTMQYYAAERKKELLLFVTA